MSILKGGTQTVNYLSFDARDQIDFSNISLNQFTVSMKVKQTSYDGGIVVLIGTDNTENWIGFWQTPGPNPRVRMNNVSYDMSSTQLPLNQLVDFTVTHDGNTIRTYLDGVLTGSISTNGEIFTINQFGDIYGNQYGFIGELYNLQIWSKALSSTEINNYISTLPSGNETDLVHYYDFQDGSGTTLTDIAGNNNGTIVGATWKVSGAYLSFDGVDDKATFNDNFNDVRYIELPQFNEFGLWKGISTYNWAIIEIIEDPNNANNKLVRYKVRTALNTLDFYSTSIPNTFNNFKLDLENRSVDVDGTIYNMTADLIRGSSNLKWSNISANMEMQFDFENFVSSNIIYYQNDFTDMKFYNTNNTLIHHYKFDESSGSTFFDSVGNSDGTIINATWDVEDVLPAIDNIYYGQPSTTAFDLASASYDNKSLSVGSQDGTARSLEFNGDGSKFYIVGTDNDNVHQYSLSTAYDISTATYDNVSFSVGGQDASPEALAFNNDGSKMYIWGQNSDRIYQYTLSTPFNISSATYDNVSFVGDAQEPDPQSVEFNNDGSKMYIAGTTNGRIYQYSLSTPYNVGTATYDNVNGFVGNEESQIRGVAFNSDGSKMLVIGTQNDTVYQYSLSTSFDVGTLSYDNASFSIQSEDTVPLDIAVNADGSKMYIVGVDTDSVYQYSIGGTIYPTIDRVYAGEALVFGTPPPILYELIADVEVTANTTQIDFDNLNITKDDELVLTGTFNNIGGNQNYLHIYANNNNTETNYYTQRLYAFSGTIGGSRDNSSYIVRSNASVKNSLKSNIKISNNDRFVVQSNTVLGVGSSGIDIRSANTVSTFSISNLTSISLVADSSSIGAGSRFTLYKINTGSA